MGALGDRARADDVVIGTVFAWMLGLGVLFLSIFTTARAAPNGTAGVRVLFGSIFGLSAADARLAAAVASLACARPARDRPAAAVRLARPGRGARPRRPVRPLGLAFLALLGAVAAEATQAVGALLLLGLLAAPAGAAHRLTANPYAASRSRPASRSPRLDRPRPQLPVPHPAAQHGVIASPPRRSSSRRCRHLALEPRRLQAAVPSSSRH